MKSSSLLVMSMTLLATCSGKVQAQLAPENSAAGGPTGIYVKTGYDICSKTSPIAGAVGYRIERTAEKEKQWREIALVEAPASLEQFVSRLREATTQIPYPFPVTQLPVDTLWRRISLHHRLDSLGVWGGLLGIHLATGSAYLDTTAAKGMKYRYRVSRIDVTGKVQTSVTSLAVSYPQTPRFADIKLVQKSGTVDLVTLRWLIGKGKRPPLIHVFRRQLSEGEFARVDAAVFVAVQAQSFAVVVSDSFVEPARLYQYYLQPYDYYGNPGAPSDSALVASLDFNAVPLPEGVQTSSMDESAGIRLNWLIPDPTFLKSVQIFRSDVWDSGYVMLAEVSPGATEFIDQAVEPMKDYFYYIQTVSILGDISFPSPRVHGLFQSALTPLPPSTLRAEPTPQGVKLTWRNSEVDIKGFYVYRADASGTSFEQVSPFIPATGTEGVYVDSNTTLSPRFTYSYVARSENTSHRLSSPSDTVYARPGIKTSPHAPLGLRASAEGQTVQLVWQDTYSGDPSLLGFKVLRRTISGSDRGSTEFKELMDSLLPASHNHYTDLSITKGKVYEYAVQAFDVFGGKSGLSSIIQLSIASETPLPPAGIRATKQTNGILVEWDEVSGSEVTGYRVYRYERGKQPVRLASLMTTVNEFSDMKAQKGQLYFYFVTSVAGVNIESGPSVEVSARR